MKKDTNAWLVYAEENLASGREGTQFRCSLPASSRDECLDIIHFFPGWR